MPEEDKKLANLYQEFFEVAMERSPLGATYLGYKHEKYDHLMPDGSLNALENDIIVALEQKRRLEKEINYENLSVEGKLDYDLIVHSIDLNLFYFLELAYWRAGAAAGGPVGTIGGAMYPLYTRDYAPVETRAKAMISRLKASPKYLEETKSVWQFPVKLWTEMAIEEGSRTIGFLQMIAQTLKTQISADLHQQLESAIAIASEAITQYTEWIRTHILPRATHDWVAGSTKFARLVELRKIGKTPSEILAIGEQALADTKHELNELAKKIDPIKTVEEIREEIKTDHPPTFEMVLEHVAALTKESREFILEHDLMDIPDNETLQVLPTPSFLIPILPFAAYMQPAKFAEHQLGTYIVTPTEGREEMLKEHNYASCKNTAVHEGYPGHHLQLASANLQENLIRSFISGDETVEGWAHYCEQLMAEKGFLGEKEVFSQMVDQLWRAVRIIVDVKLSTGQMTFNEAKELMMTEIGMDENAVISELKRYTATPSYQFSYLLGKFMLLDVREEVKLKMGSKYKDKFFHNTILYNGGLPIHFLRRLFDLRIPEAIKI